jgi:MFS family permease
MLGAITMTGIAMMTFSQSQWLPFSLFVLLFLGVGEMGYWSSNNTILQTTVPDELRGRVTSIAMLAWGLAPLGTLTAGALADVIGAPTTVTLLGAATVGFAVFAGLKYADVRNYT